jgi:DinB superfamily
MLAGMTINPYAVHLEGRDPRDVIAATPQRLQQLAGRIGAAAITEAPAPGKWSARDILCHLADCEIVFAFRLRQALAEDHHVIQPFDQNLWAKTYGTGDAAAALTTFAALRAWNIALLKDVTPEQLRRPVTHPQRGEMPFDAIVETMGGHDLNHVKQLELIAARPTSPPLFGAPSAP